MGSSDLPENVRRVTARPELERFYHDVTTSAVRNGLSDAELAAILANMCGRMIGAALPGDDQDTIRDTVVFNIKDGRDVIPGLLAAVGKGT